MQALRRVLLVPAQHALQHVVTGSKNIAHIVENRETEPFSQEGQADRWKAELLAVHKQSGATDGETGTGIARSCLI